MKVKTNLKAGKAGASTEKYMEIKMTDVFISG